MNVPSVELDGLADLLDVVARRLRALAHVAPMKVICGWCQRVLADGSLPATHAICPSCITRLEAGYRP